MEYKSTNLRNVVLLGHPGSGKTSLAECMLFEAGAINRRGTIDDLSTISDYTELEHERRNSVFSTLMHAHWKDSKINVMDTPGFDDFIGEVVAAMKVADTALMLLNARNGVEVGTELIWEYVEKFRTPTVFIVNQVEHEKADFELTLEQAISRFGPRVMPIQYPLEHGQGFHTIIDALTMTAYVFKEDGGKPEKEPIPAAEMERAKAMHNALVEAAAENDEGLMERFFESGTLSEEDLASGLRIAIANQQIFPVFCTSALYNMGSGRVMGFINDICPSPADTPPALLADGSTLPCDAYGKTSVFIYKTITEPRVGLVSYFKVYSGVLHAGDELVNACNQLVERFGQLFVVNGKQRDAVQQLSAGDIGATVKLKNSHTNNTLNTKGTDRAIYPMDFPESRIRVAVEAASKSDMEKLFKALHQLEEEDPTLVMEQSPALKQTLLHAQGQLHLDLVKYRVEKGSGVEMNMVRPRIAYRETITRTANTQYRHKKQTGGAGQFAEVHMRIEPYFGQMDDPADLPVRSKEIEELPWGGTLAFYWCVVGGSIDAKYASAIKKGIMQKMEEGPLTGSHCQDIRVCITDGKMHAVDSNDMAFMLAATHAFKDAFVQAAPRILEPVFDVEVLCSEETMGEIMGDLQTRRAVILGMEAANHYQKIVAKVPQMELYQYSSTLRSLSQGRAKFTRKFAEYQPATPEIQQQLIAAHRED